MASTAAAAPPVVKKALFGAAVLKKQAPSATKPPAPTQAPPPAPAPAPTPAPVPPPAKADEDMPDISTTVTPPPPPPSVAAPVQPPHEEEEEAEEEDHADVLSYATDAESHAGAVSEVEAGESEAEPAAARPARRAAKPKPPATKQQPKQKAKAKPKAKAKAKAKAESDDEKEEAEEDGDGDGEGDVKASDQSAFELLAMQLENEAVIKRTNMGARMGDILERMARQVCLESNALGRAEREAALRHPDLADEDEVAATQEYLTGFELDKDAQDLLASACEAELRSLAARIEAKNNDYSKSSTAVGAPEIYLMRKYGRRVPSTLLNPVEQYVIEMLRLRECFKHKSNKMLSGGYDGHRVFDVHEVYRTATDGKGDLAREVEAYKARAAQEPAVRKKIDSFKGSEQMLEMHVACNNADFKTYFAAMKETLNKAQIADMMGELEDGADLKVEFEEGELEQMMDSERAKQFIESHPRPARLAGFKSLQFLAGYSVTALNAQEAAEQAAYEKKQQKAASRSAARKRRQQETSAARNDAIDEEINGVIRKAAARKKRPAATAETSSESGVEDESEMPIPQKQPAKPAAPSAQNGHAGQKAPVLQGGIKKAATNKKAGGIKKPAAKKRKQQQQEEEESSSSSSSEASSASSGSDAESNSSTAPQDEEVLASGDILSAIVPTPPAPTAAAAAPVVKASDLIKQRQLKKPAAAASTWQYAPSKGQQK